MIFKILHFSGRLCFILFKVHILVVCPKLNRKVLEEHFNFTFWLTFINISARAFIKIYVDLSVIHIKSIIWHKKLTWVRKVWTNNSLLEPGIKKINIDLIIPEITLRTPFYWYSSCCRIEGIVKIETLFFKINVCIRKYIFDWRIHINHFSLNPTEE